MRVLLWIVKRDGLAAAIARMQPIASTMTPTIPSRTVTANLTVGDEFRRYPKTPATTTLGLSIGAGCRFCEPVAHKRAAWVAAACRDDRSPRRYAHARLPSSTGRLRPRQLAEGRTPEPDATRPQGNHVDLFPGLPGTRRRPARQVSSGSGRAAGVG